MLERHHHALPSPHGGLKPPSPPSAAPSYGCSASGCYGLAHPYELRPNAAVATNNLHSQHTPCLPSPPCSPSPKEHFQGMPCVNRSILAGTPPPLAPKHIPHGHTCSASVCPMASYISMSWKAMLQLLSHPPPLQCQCVPRPFRHHGAVPCTALFLARPLTPPPQTHTNLQCQCMPHTSP
jgi:hypothetical protein